MEGGGPAFSVWEGLPGRLGAIRQAVWPARGLGAAREPWTDGHKSPLLGPTRSDLGGLLCVVTHLFGRLWLRDPLIPLRLHGET